MNTTVLSSRKDPTGNHPRPQLRRKRWTTLNGEWECHIDADGQLTSPRNLQWDRTIQVPFSPETKMSGVGETGFIRAVWYRRNFECPRLDPGERLIVHLEAVDYRARVYINGQKVRTHEGGYCHFDADITEALVPGKTQEIIVWAQDDPADLAKPRGKQDWKLQPHSIWYPRTTGIWQTVWLEPVPAAYVGCLQWSSSLDRWDIGIDAIVHSGPGQRMTLAVELKSEGELIASDTYEVISGEVHRRIALSDPGIDDFRNDLLWTPSSPRLIDANVELRDDSGTVIDRIESYAAIRSVATHSDRFLLNGRPFYLRLVLDQGYWPESGLTAPSDEALVQDILLAKELGFNGVRKHQKIESARYLYWADRLGLLVWEEMPSAYRYTGRSIERLTREWIEIINRDSGHPCIVAWVPFNESWGVPDLPESPAQRHYVEALYHLTKSLDPSRPVIGNDGWESVATDIVGIHDYDEKPERIGHRYGINEIESQLFKRERPGGRVILMGGEAKWSHPIVLTEFGGIALGDQREGDWGYSRTRDANEFLEKYSALLETVRNLPALAGFCYTQFTDTYQEANGLLYENRTPKAPMEEIALATRGVLPDQDVKLETQWREDKM